MIKKLVITLLILSTASIGSSAQASELRTSDLCNRYFPIFEADYHMPSNMLRAVSVTESGRWSQELKKNIAWPWTINVGGKGYHFQSKAKAIAKVKQLMAKGRKSIDVGCMQINLKYHPDAFISLEQAFEPRYNIAYAAKFLKRKYDSNDSWETAIRHYHNIHTKYSNKYIARVYKTWRVEDKAVNVALLDSPALNITVKQRPNRPSSDISDITQSTLDRFIQ